MLTIMEIIEKARLAGMEKFVDVDSVNRGWYVNLLSEDGKKVRMTDVELAEQEAFIQDCFREAEKADEPVPTITNEIANEEPKKPAKKTKKEMSEIDWEQKLKYINEVDENGIPYEISLKLANHILNMADQGKASQIKTVIIKCEDCGRRRMVKIQDAHQVTRCHFHMREARNARRRKSTN